MAVRLEGSALPLPQGPFMRRGHLFAVVAVVGYERAFRCRGCGCSPLEASTFPSKCCEWDPFGG